MVHQLQNTYYSVELWYDSDFIKTAWLDTFTSTRVDLHFELSDGLYFKSPVQFLLKRDTRADFNFISPTNDASVKSYSTKTIDDVEYVYGVNKLGLGKDTETRKVEIIINPNNVINIEDPEEPPIEEPEEPETVQLTIPSYSSENNYSDLLDTGKITLTINGETISSSSVITVEKHSTFAIEITNNQLNQKFDYNRITFIESQYVPPEGYVTIDRTPDVQTDNQMIFNINPDNWDKMLSGSSSPLIIKALPLLQFTARETEPVENYPFLRLYKVDDDSLNELATEINEKRYNQESDLSGNILDLVRIPYAIQTEPDLESINLNNEAMNSQGYQILNYLQEINLGKIRCYHDTLVNVGYKNIEFNLFVPNFKPISLNVSKVIDRTIEMKLNIDLTTGQGTLNLLMSGTTFHIEQAKITKDIPFKTDNNRISLEDNVLNTNYLNPYLEIIVLNPDNSINAHELKQRNVDKSSLSYVKSDSIVMNSKATYSEQLEIEMLIRKGVYING